MWAENLRDARNHATIAPVAEEGSKMMELSGGTLPANPSGNIGRDQQRHTCCRPTIRAISLVFV
jgi:hypothetical protein